MGNSNVAKCWANGLDLVGTTFIQCHGLPLYPEAPNTFSNVGPTNPLGWPYFSLTHDVIWEWTGRNVIVTKLDVVNTTLLVSCR